MKILVLRFDAPMMSFGATKVDAYGPTDMFPRRSMVTGLFGNALGWDRTDDDPHTRLQDRLRIASRCDRNGSSMRDFQTVDLSQPFLKNGWTTRGELEGRSGAGKTKNGTHIRHRYYRVDSVYTVVVTLVPANQSPTLEDLADALQEPARPLFLGRACCLPAAPIFRGFAEAPGLRVALASIPRIPRRPGSEQAGEDRPLMARWPEDDPGAGQDEEALKGTKHPITEDRDWCMDVCVGRSWVIDGTVDPPRSTAGAMEVRS